MYCLDGFHQSMREVASIEEHAIQLLHENKPGAREVANAITRSGLVLLCGYVEGFVRDMIEEAVDEINSFGLKPHELPAGLLEVLIESVLEVSGKKREAALQKFKSDWMGESSCELSGKKLANTGGNPTVDNVESIFSVFGLMHVIDQLSISHFAVESTFAVEAQSKSLEASILS